MTHVPHAHACTCATPKLAQARAAQHPSHPTPFPGALSCRTPQAVRAGPMEHQQDLHRELFPLVLKLTSAEQRESALLELSKKRETFQDLAPILWHSVGTMSALLQVRRDREYAHRRARRR